MSESVNIDEMLPYERSTDIPETLHDDLQMELLEMERMLKYIQRGAKHELSCPPTLTAAELERARRRRRDQANSSWAKSLTPKDHSFKQRRELKANTISDKDLRRAEVHTKFQSPCMALMKPSSKPETSTKENHMPEQSPSNAVRRNINDFGTSSKYTRTKSSTFGKAKRESFIPETKDSNTSEAPPLSSESKIYSAALLKDIKGFRFCKSRRAKDESDIIAPATVLDVERADKWRYNRPPTPLMKAPTTTTKQVAPISDTLETDLPTVKIDSLSHVYSSPGVVMRRPSDPTPHAKILEYDKAKASLIGPGSYDVKDAMVDAISQTKFGKFPEEISQTKMLATLKKKLLSRHSDDSMDSAAPDILACDEKLRCKTPTTRIYPEKVNESIHLQRKRYFEEKADDAREFHDNQKAPSDAFCRSKVPYTKIQDPLKSILVTDEKINRIHRQRQAERLRDDSSRPYDLESARKHVEKAPITTVTMHAEVKSRESIQALLANKSKALEVIHDKHVSRDIMYGPQLPVAWVSDDKYLPSFTKIHNRPVSPTTEVLDFFNKRSTAVRSETAENYAKSSIAGTISHKPTAILREDKPSISKKLPEDRPEDIYTELVDWTKEINPPNRPYKGNSLRMDLAVGRKDIRIHSKGVIDVIDFDDVRYGLDLDEDHDLSCNGNPQPFGRDVKGFVDFDKMKSRYENNEWMDRHDSNAHLALYDCQRLDLDPNAAKDYLLRKKDYSKPLYQTDRFPPDEVETKPLIHHDDTRDWFKGMTDEVISRNTKAVDYSKMSGREDYTKHPQRKEIVDDVLGDLAEDEIAIDIDIYKDDSFGGQVKGLQFKDPISYPRFNQDDERNKYESRLDLQTKYQETFKSNRNLDMNRMIGRQNDEDMNMIKDEIHGRIDVKLAIESESARDKAMDAAHDLSTKRNPPKKMISMDKMSSRHQDNITNHIDDITGRVDRDLAIAMEKEKDIHRDKGINMLSNASRGNAVIDMNRMIAYRDKDSHEVDAINEEVYGRVPDEVVVDIASSRSKNVERVRDAAMKQPKAVNLSRQRGRNEDAMTKEKLADELKL